MTLLIIDLSLLPMSVPMGRFEEESSVFGHGPNFKHGLP